jgi:hypothetical protein
MPGNEAIYNNTEFSLYDRFRDILELPSLKNCWLYAVSGFFHSSAYFKLRPLVPELIINLRNRFFHYNSSISSEQIVDSDMFFRIINAPFLRWFSSLLTIILATLYENTR